MITTPIRKKEEIDMLKQYFLSEGDYRDYVLFVLGINLALRITDLLSLRWQDVYNTNRCRFKSHVYVLEKKTKKQNCIALNQSCISSLQLYMKHSFLMTGEEFLFCQRRNPYQKISRNRAYHIIKKAAQATNIEGNISCHSLRKTFGYHAWKNNVPPALIMNIYNHSNMEITKRYLSIVQDDKDELFWKMNL